jgi:hypothetical protein
VKLADSSPASATATSFSYGDAGSSCDDQSICNWKPNPNSTSQLTKDWFAAHQGQASATVDNVYKVKFGDDLEGIAKRELKAEGKEGSSVKDEVAKIIRLNHDHYKSLDCNKDFIRTGWTLKLNDNSVAAAPPQQTDAAPPAPAPVTTPDTTCKVDAPCGADVIVDNPNGQTFYNGKKVGDHDRSIVTHGQAVEVPIPGNGPPPPQRIGDAATPAAATPVADAPSTPAPAAAAKPIETAAAASPDTPPPVVAPKAIDSALVVAAPDTPPPVVSSKPIVAAAPDTPPPVVPASQTPDTSAAALTPGPDEVQAPVAPANAPPPRRVAATPPPAAPSAAPDAPPNSQTASGSPAVPLDGDALGPS